MYSLAGTFLRVKHPPQRPGASLQARRARFVTKAGDLAVQAPDNQYHRFGRIRVVMVRLGARHSGSGAFRRFGLDEDPDPPKLYRGHRTAPAHRRRGSVCPRHRAHARVSAGRHRTDPLRPHRPNGTDPSGLTARLDYSRCARKFGAWPQTAPTPGYGVRIPSPRRPLGGPMASPRGRVWSEPWITTYGPSESEAEQHSRTRSAITGGPAFFRQADPVGDYPRAWLDRSSPSLRLSTRRSYDLAVRLWISPRLGSVPVSPLTGRQVQTMARPWPASMVFGPLASLTRCCAPPLMMLGGWIGYRSQLRQGRTPPSWRRAPTRSGRRSRRPRSWARWPDSLSRALSAAGHGGSATRRGSWV